MSDCSSISPKVPRYPGSPSPSEFHTTKGVLVPLTDNIALVSLTSNIPTSVFLQVAAAAPEAGDA